MTTYTDGSYVVWTACAVSENKDHEAEHDDDMMKSDEYTHSTEFDTLLWWRLGLELEWKWKCEWEWEWEGGGKVEVGHDCDLNTGDCDVEEVGNDVWVRHTDLWMKCKHPCSNFQKTDDVEVEWDGCWPIKYPPIAQVGPSVTAHYMGHLVEIVWNNGVVCVRASKIKKKNNAWYVVISKNNGEIFRRRRVTTDIPLTMIDDIKVLSDVVTHLEETQLIGSDLLKLICA